MGHQSPPFPARLGRGPLTWKMPVRTVMVATSSTLAASRCSSLTIVTLVPLTNSRKLSLGSRESVKLPIMTEITAKGPGDRKGLGREPQDLSEVHCLLELGSKHLGSVIANYFDGANLR